ncbi:MAG: DUF2283 domain-containing protein [Methanobrevibacter sp.]|uniref:DUF2283 domain-containing protein n=1 Tax=Methanobrevibacter sp. TaxID=66852 RepID=UPI0025E0DF66|nr:DUF2283 domain-containing protein [Methanobrevibacter sp.]MBQ8017808.1 DUF2283 domain-containing protein [Methanobrevibacter sp.]MBQ9027101.1 DUF2283 domain-containing protein [Methanobrevibacter sp.]
MDLSINLEILNENEVEITNINEIKKVDTEYTYDSRLDIIRIEVKEKYKSKESIELESGIYLDFDENYFPVNLEINDASKRIEVDEKFLTKPSGNVKIVIDKESIYVEVTFKNNNRYEFLNLDTIGEDYLPNIKTDFAIV